MFGNFNDTDLFKNDLGEENIIEDVIFHPERAQAEWLTATAYTTDDQVWSDGKIYKATNTATSGATAPTHEIGNVTDGSVIWQYISAAGPIEVDLRDHPWPTPTEPLWQATKSYALNDLVYFGRQNYKLSLIHI